MYIFHRMCRHTLYNRTYNCIIVGIQSDHRTLEKADTIPNFTVKKVKNLISISSAILITKMTTAVLKFQPKNIEIKRFWFQTQAFYSCRKFCNQTNLRALISNMRILSLNSSPKIIKPGIFGPKFKNFCFCTKLCCKTTLRARI